MKNRSVPSDAELPTPAMPLHSANFRFFKNPLYTVDQVVPLCISEVWVDERTQ